MADPYKSVVVGGGLKLKGVPPKAAASPAAKAYVGEHRTAKRSRTTWGLRATSGQEVGLKLQAVCGATSRTTTRTRRRRRTTRTDKGHDAGGVGQVLRRCGGVAWVRAWGSRTLPEAAGSRGVR